MKLHLIFTENEWGSLSIGVELLAVKKRHFGAQLTLSGVGKRSSQGAEPPSGKKKTLVITSF